MKEKGQRRPGDQKGCKFDDPLHGFHSCTGKCDLVPSLEYLVLDDETSISLDAEDPYHTNHNQPKVVRSKKVKSYTNND